MGHDQGSEGMEPTEDLGEYTTLIVRIRQDNAGRLSGVVERVRTGEKVRFHGLETLNRAVASLFRPSPKGADHDDDTGNECGRPRPAKMQTAAGDRVHPAEPRQRPHARRARGRGLHESLSLRATLQGQHWVPPHRFVVRQRITRARGVLATPDLSIAQISRLVGFRTPSHFTTVFRRALGITPGAYRTTVALREDRPRPGRRVR